MNIYEMNDCDWYAAETPEQAVEAMATDLDVSVEELKQDGMIGKDCPRLLCDKEMDSLPYLTSEEPDYDKVDEHISFRTQLERMIARGDKFPCRFATTEY